ncbi:MAG: arginine N-succinyltransferase [Waddliaceae bacterium]
MYIVRALEKGDFDKLLHFTDRSSYGLLSLPKDHEKLIEKLNQSLSDFRKEVMEPKSEIYFFVLENTKTKEIGGCCAIYSKTAVKIPYYFFLVDQDLLHPFSLVDGPAELCALYLAPEFRSQGLGTFLSISRLMFIANFPSRFEKQIMARIRGVITKEGNSPLWNALGQHFFHLSFKEAEIALEANPDFVGEHLPIHPIYTCFLDDEARSVIGKPHPNSEGSLKILEKQGFKLTDWIDTFDGGPVLETSVQEIELVKKSTLATVQEIKQVEDGIEAMVGNRDTAFRVCQDTIRIIDKTHVQISPETADALQVTVGGTIRYAKL